MNMMLLGCMPSQQIYKGRLGRIIKKCVALNPDDRYSGVLKLKEALPYVKREKIRDIMPVKEGFAPPGFRSKDPLKMIVALCGYTAVLALSFGFKKENYIQTYKMFADRLCFCAACFAIVCFYTNWRGFADLFPLTRSRSRILRTVSHIISPVMILFFLLALMYLAEKCLVFFMR